MKSSDLSNRKWDAEEDRSLTVDHNKIPKLIWDLSINTSSIKSKQIMKNEKEKKIKEKDETSTYTDITNVFNLI